MPKNVLIEECGLPSFLLFHINVKHYKLSVVMLIPGTNTQLYW